MFDKTKGLFLKIIYHFVGAFFIPRVSYMVVVKVVPRPANPPDWASRVLL